MTLDPVLSQAFSSYTPAVRRKLNGLRRLILRVAKSDPAIGPLEEALRWNQLSFLTTTSKSGSTIRIDALPSPAGHYALYFHCQTTLVSSFREKYGSKLTYEGNRALIFSATKPIPVKIVEACVHDALTYHRQRRHSRLPIGRLIK